MELIDYIRVLRKAWVWILVLTVVGVGAAGAYSIVKPPTYTAESKVFVSTESGGTAQNLELGNAFTQDRVTSYADLVTTPAVLDPVIAGLHLESSAAELAAMVSASAPANTTLLEIDAEAGRPQLAADIANATADSLSDVVSELETTGADDGASPVKLSRVQSAAVPSTPSSPKLSLDLALGLLVGLALGIGVAVLRETLDTRVRTERDIAALTGIPIVGGITFDAKAGARPLIVHDEPFSAGAEAFRTLRTNLQYLAIGRAEESRRRGRSFLITSSIDQEGKTTTVANLAIAVASASDSVLVVDADLRRPKLADYLGIEGAVGLTDVLLGRADLADAVQRWGDGRLYVLAAGRVPPNPSEMLGSARMQKLIEALEERFDHVLFDTPPLLPVTDAVVLSAFVSGTIAVVSAGRTHRNQLRAALGSLEQVGSAAAGIVMTMVPTKGPDAYSYGRYGYGYYGSVPSSGPSRRAKGRRKPKRQKARRNAAVQP